MSVYEKFQVPTVVNAAGPVTRYGGSSLSEGVLSAMAEATKHYVRLDELQLAVGRKLSEWTGAESGYVTTGAASGLAMGAAAIMAGFDVGRMDQLPDTEGIPNRFILQESHRSIYDHAIRSSGAELATVDCREDADQAEIRTTLESAKTEKTCGSAYVFRTADRGVPLDDWVRAAHEVGLPVLVDASVRLPPFENLRTIPGSGADLVAFSGGKAIQGPQGSGFVVGKKDWIDSMLLQNQDMDVIADTWFLREWIREGRLPQPPPNGIGRGYKVSKETIIGLMVALEESLERNPEADQRAWNERIDLIVAGLEDHPCCRIEKSFDPQSPYPVPMGILRLTEEAMISLEEFVNRCARLNKPILFEEGTLESGFLIIHPMCLTDEDSQTLVFGVRSVLLE